MRCTAITLTYAIEAAGSWQPWGGGHGVCGFLCAACSLLLVGCWMLVVGSSVLYSYLWYVPYSIDTGAFVFGVHEYTRRNRYVSHPVYWEAMEIEK